MKTLTTLGAAALLLATTTFATGCTYEYDSASYFAEDWQQTYWVLRAADNTTCHETAHPIGGYYEVWVNPTGTPAASAETPPDKFPEGTVLLKAQWETDPTCTPGEWSLFTVMKKGAPGTNPDQGDWLWQTVDGDGSVQSSGPSNWCTDCHVTNCGGLSCVFASE